VIQLVHVGVANGVATMGIDHPDRNVIDKTNLRPFQVHEALVVGNVTGRNDCDPGRRAVTAWRVRPDCKG
jgi:hypothetical protein